MPDDAQPRPRPFCEATHTQWSGAPTPDSPLRCDRAPGHRGRHAETYVASWEPDGSALRWTDEDPRP